MGKMIDADELLKRLRRPTDFLERVNYVTHDGKVYFQDTYIKEIIDSLTQAQPSPQYQSMLDDMDTKAIADHVSKHNPLLQPKPNKLDEILASKRIGNEGIWEAITELYRQLKELRGERVD